ncbi:MAG: hypothetical protein NC824_03860 [Candidatus Omnitrophica bacterium]|nr:hypothetical protein [Candidatus Omnitrophota bacterium]
MLKKELKMVIRRRISRAVAEKYWAIHQKVDLSFVNPFLKWFKQILWSVFGEVVLLLLLNQENHPR